MIHAKRDNFSLTRSLARDRRTCESSLGATFITQCVKSSTSWKDIQVTFFACSIRVMAAK